MDILPSSPVLLPDTDAIISHSLPHKLLAELFVSTDQFEQSASLLNFG